MGTLNVGRVNASTLDAAAALNFPSYTTGNRPSSGIDTGATIYNSTDEKLQTWNGEEWMDIGGGSEPDGSSADKELELKRIIRRNINIFFITQIQYL